MRFETHPKVNIVTSLVVRRQMRCRFTPDSFCRLLRKLPRLEHLCYELRNEDDLAYVSGAEPDSEATISQQELPPNLKSLTMFEDPESYFSLILGSALPWRDKLPEPSIGAVLAKSSLSLEQLSASFFMEANDFFTACRANWIWKDLHSLVLTSMLLNPNADASEVNGILYAAGMAAHHMPQLQTMEIWNGNFECACIFRYNVTWNCATLTLLRSWDLDLEARVIQPWEDVARTHGHDTLCVNVHSLSMSNIQSCTDIIDYLKLKQHVLHPVSLRQIQREARGSTSVFGHGFGLFM